MNGNDVKDYSLSELREKIGVVPQRAVLFKGNLRDNMKWGKRDATDEEIYQALDIAQAREFVNSKEQGLELMIEQGGKNLSGGQKQRVAIARALITKPAIILADEPTGNLDVKSGQNVLGLLKMSVETYHQTLIMITHNLEIAQMADCVVRIEDGRLKA